MTVISLKLRYYVTNMNRREKEKLVISLRQQGMTYAQIAKEAHVSPRDIGPILNMAGVQETLSNSSRAYKLFAEGKSPIDVAVLLNLREKEVTELYTEFWRLCHLRDLYHIYEEVKADMSFLIELYRSMTYEGMNIEHVIKLLDIANNHLPSVESKYENLRKEINSLENANRNLARTYQQLRDDVSSLDETIGKLQSTVGQLRREVTKLNLQKLRTEKSVKHFQNNNEMVVKIRQMVRQELESFMPNPKRLLKAALISIFQASRNHPGKLIAMSYNLPSNLLSGSFIDLDLRYPRHHNYLYNADAAFENFLLDQAEELYNKIIDDITNKSVNVVTNETEASSQMLPVPNVLPAPSTDECHSTAIDVFTNDAELPYLQGSVPDILSMPSLHEDHHTSHNPSADEISISKIYSNWANEYVKNLRFTNKQNIDTTTPPREDESET